MSKFYNAKRVQNLFNPQSDKPFKLSRSKIELFIECKKCFYLDRRLGIGRPPSFPLNLNLAVDELLKKEFDIHRIKQEAHPLQIEYNIDAKPIFHDRLDEWRGNFKGLKSHHPATNFIITGAIDDLWQNSAGEYIIVDYKATSKKEDVRSFGEKLPKSYKRQMEIYQWLLRKNGYIVSDTGYFVYCNGDRNKEAFNSKLEFDMAIIPYVGKDFWVDKIITEAYDCLISNKIPKAMWNCDYCLYRDSVNKEEK